jgi:hypothetical protein
VNLTQARHGTGRPVSADGRIRRLGIRRLGIRRLAVALLRTTWLYASAGFGYVAASAVFRPRQVGDHLWHSLPWLRKDTFGIVCFAVSALTFLVLRLVDRRPAWPAEDAGAPGHETAA